MYDYLLWILNNVILPPLLWLIERFFGLVNDITKMITNFFTELIQKGSFGLLTPLVVALFIVFMLFLVMILPKLFWRLIDLLPF